MRRVAIDQHSHMSNEEAKVLLEDSHRGSASDDNPCSYLGCNSHTCAWASGGVITRLVAKKACSNALTLGTGEGTRPADATSSTDSKISTLKDCVNLVRSQSSSCSGHFQLHKGTWACSCVPAGGTCTEQEDENVCRYQVVEQ